MTWTLPARLIHWIVAACIFFDFFSEGGDLPHNFAGYLAAGLVLLRIGYGIGRTFPRENKLASLVYWLIWLDVVALAISGYLMGTDEFWGDEMLHSVHAQLSNSLMILTALHLSGVALHSIRFKKKTWMGMITGRRP